MYSKREWIIFFIGFEAFHTLSHLLISFNGVLPITFFGFTITKSFNMFAILINLVITIGLYIWAEKTR